jgi:hypothetical protein
VSFLVTEHKVGKPVSIKTNGLTGIQGHVVPEMRAGFDKPNKRQNNPGHSLALVPFNRQSSFCRV